MPSFSYVPVVPLFARVRLAPSSVTGAKPLLGEKSLTFVFFGVAR
ncbi:hypothetical protein [Streptomyces sp. 2A115]